MTHAQGIGIIQLNLSWQELQPMQPAITYIYRPPASGKLTVAEVLKDLTGYPLFHNHLSVNVVASVFPFGSEAFNAVLHRLRLDVLETAAREGTGLVFTNNSAWGGAEAHARFASFANDAKLVVESQGGRTVFVHLRAPQEILEERIANESRRAHLKLLDVNQLRELLIDLDRSPLHADDLSIDTSITNPHAAAQEIYEKLQLDSLTRPN
jgi:hypothetical protein